MTSNITVAASGHEAVGNLPAEPNAFVGRERDLAELETMLYQVRALTLCGPGGIGKTRLALRLAAGLAPRFPDGAWVADLADADAPDRLVPAVAAALGIRPEPDRSLADTLTEALRGRTMLLILDTCEHLVQECAELVQRLLSDCPGLRVIATSREALRVRGEVIWRVPPLGLPAAGDLEPAAEPATSGSEAVQLFWARAASVRPGLRLRDEEAAHVAEICQTLDGVPLAIELAAARVRSLSAAQVRARLADKFEFLAHGDRTAPPRQQTLRATVEWSFDLLTEPERTLLRRLSVFHGWTLDEAERICAGGQLPASEVLDLLTALIDKSLVSVDQDAAAGPKYRLLEVVREFAAELAGANGETEVLQSAHRDCMVELAESVASVAFVRGDPPWPERVAMYHRIAGERANFQLALGYCVRQGEAEIGLRLCHALSGYWLASGEVTDGAGWTDRLLALEASVDPGVSGRALAVRAELAFEQLDYQGAAKFATECLELSGPDRDGNPATGYRLLSLTELMADRVGDALRLADQAVAAARQMNDDWEIGMALAARAAALAGRGDLAQAQSGFTDALDLLEGNNRWGVANVLYGLGQIARGRADVTAAERYFEEALAIYSEIDARPEMARCLGVMGILALRKPDLAAARVALDRSMQLNLAAGQRLGVARGLAALAELAAAQGDSSRAVRVAGAALALFAEVGVASSRAAIGRLERLIDGAASGLGPDAAASLAQAGRALDPRQAAELARGAQAAELARGAQAAELARGAQAAELAHGAQAASAPAQPVNGAIRAAGPPLTAAPATGSAAISVSPAAVSPAAVSPAAAVPAAPVRAAPVPAAPTQPAWPGSLSGREREVATLLAVGLSNRAIGQRLFISPATVARHIANIFSKHGFRSRAEVTAWVRRSGQGPS
jgi:predicted ATPase/DNA-binding CsgD family transcriptional regulator